MQPEDMEVRRWLLKARHDWSAARKILTSDCEETDVASFHCQQAVEKLLKAFLVARGIPFEKMHDLRRLLDYCAAADGAFDELRDDVEPLTLYAIAFRYPGPADPTINEVETAMRVVERVWNFVTERLNDDAIQPPV